VVCPIFARWPGAWGLLYPFAEQLDSAGRAAYVRCVAHSTASVDPGVIDSQTTANAGLSGQPSTISPAEFPAKSQARLGLQVGATSSSTPSPDLKGRVVRQGWPVTHPQTHPALRHLPVIRQRRLTATGSARQTVLCCD